MRKNGISCKLECLLDSEEKPSFKLSFVVYEDEERVFGHII